MERVRQSTLPSLKKSIEDIKTDKSHKKLSEFDKYKIGLLKKDASRRHMASLTKTRVGRSETAAQRDLTMDSEDTRDVCDPYRKIKEPLNPD